MRVKNISADGGGGAVVVKNARKTIQWIHLCSFWAGQTIGGVTVDEGEGESSRYRRQTEASSNDIIATGT